MPGNQQKPESLDMDSDMSPSCGLSDLSRGGSLESRSSSSRSRSFTMDDESLKHLTHEEKDVILFFEETLDSLEYDLDEATLCDSGIHCHSPQSLEESPSSHSEPEDVIDLVQPAPASGEAESLPDVPPPVAGSPSVAKQSTPFLEGGKQATENSLPPPDSRGPEVLPLPPSLPMPAPSASQKELMSPSPPAEHPKLPRSVPTPLVIAQKISEKLGGNEALSPTSPSKESRPGEWRTPTSLASRNEDHVGVWHRHTAQPAPKVHRFPSNISVTNSAGKDFNKTISKAAVNVQERKAQVLANINGMSFITAGDTSSEERWQKAEEQRSGSADGARTLGRVGMAGEPGALRAGVRVRAQQSRAVQTEQPPALANGFQSVHEALRSEPSSFIPTSKTITIRPDPSVTGKLARQNASRSLYEPRPDGSQDARRRTGSLPRAVGFRPQGITVQFSGRGSTEEARREALRKLGLLKENL